MKTKTWKLGEYTLGGVLTVEITGKIISVIGKKWDQSKGWSRSSNQSGAREFTRGTCEATDPGARRKLEDFLNDLTTSYYAGKILEWIESKVELAEPEFFGSFHNYSGRQGTKKPYGQNRANATLIR